MTDPRVAKLADLLVNYSLELGPGQTVRIDGGTVAAPLVTEIYRYALRAGAHPRTRIEVEDLELIALTEGSEEQFARISEIDRFEVEHVDAVVTLWGDRNTRSLSQVEPQRVSRRMAARRTLVNRFWERIDAGEARWVGTRFPTEASTTPSRTLASIPAPTHRRPCTSVASARTQPTSLRASATDTSTPARHAS